MCKLLTFPHFPSVGKLKTIFKTIFKIIYKTIFSFGIGLLFENVMSILVEPPDLEKVPDTSSPSPASPDNHTTF